MIGDRGRSEAQGASCLFDLVAHGGIGNVPAIPGE